jgi:mannose-6-phosphate isomerase-like protein (cupin superfamily)
MKAISDQAEPLALDEADLAEEGWDDPVRGRIRWRTLFSKGMTPTAGMTCGVADLASGDWLGLHRHAPAEVYYVFAGAGLMTLDGREIPVKAGSAVFIPGIGRARNPPDGKRDAAPLLRLPGRFVRGGGIPLFRRAARLTALASMSGSR